ncbi:MAG: response regulator transcription factor [Spirochaetales bacterium]|nr:response regulator transcription factor [Spirochaetales bacterium]
MMKRSLLREGYEVHSAPSLPEALHLLRTADVSVILLDLNLGDRDGRDIIALLRRQGSDIPIIVVSHYTEIETKVHAFELGCDDYLTKPFHTEELLARIKRLGQRTVQCHSSQIPFQERITTGPFLVDYQDRTVQKEGKTLHLNGKLFELFAYFVSNQNQLISKEQLLSRFWWNQDHPSENTLSVHIHMLREQLEENPKLPQYLLTKRGQGYIFTTQSSG